jgi:DNA-binding HxlR family transcriptional regulator
MREISATMRGRRWNVNADKGRKNNAGNKAASRAEAVGSDSLERLTEAAHAAASLLARRWVLPILGSLATHPQRRFQLALKLEGISPKVLTDTLRVLEQAGLVSRILVRESETTVGIGYELTSLGRSFEQPVAALARWYTPAREANPSASIRSGRPRA